MSASPSSSGHSGHKATNQVAMEEHHQQVISARDMENQDKPSNINLKKNKLFVSKLDPQTSIPKLKQQLHQLFCSFGKIASINVKHNFSTSSSYAFIEYEQGVNGQQAVRQLNGEWIGEAKIQVDVHSDDKRRKTRDGDDHGDRANRGTRNSRTNRHQDSHDNNINNSSSRRCFNCQQSGHIARDCTQPRKSSNKDRQSHHESRHTDRNHHHRSRSHSHSRDRKRNTDRKQKEQHKQEDKKVIKLSDGDNQQPEKDQTNTKQGMLSPRLLSSDSNKIVIRRKSVSSSSSSSSNSRRRQRKDSNKKRKKPTKHSKRNRSSSSSSLSSSSSSSSSSRRSRHIK